MKDSDLRREQTEMSRELEARRRSAMDEVLSPLQTALTIHSTEAMSASYYEYRSPFVLQYVRHEPGVAHGYHLTTYAPEGVSHVDVDIQSLTGLPEEPPPHSVNTVRLLAVLEGEVLLNLEGKRILYTRDTACLLGPAIREIESFSTAYEMVFLNLTPEYIRRFDPESGGFLFGTERHVENPIWHALLNAEFWGEHRYLDLCPSQNSQRPNALRDILQEMRQILQAPFFGATFALMERTTALFAVLSDSSLYQMTWLEQKANMDAMLFSRISMLLRAEHGRISRSVLSERLSYSGAHISRVVKKYTGMSLFDYSMTLCLSRAAVLLVTTRRPVSEIMEELSFSNQTHFYQLFRERYGMSPGEYRQSGQQEAPGQGHHLLL